MGACKFCGQTHKIGFVSTRLAGTDGVSLETDKWADVFEEEGASCYYLAGELDSPPDSSFLVEEAHFMHPVIRDIYQKCFGVRTRSREVTDQITQLTAVLKDQNALTIPLNLPFGIALTQVISETGMPTIAHHHDFFWERQHFMTNAVWEYLNMAFPPHLYFTECNGF
jgi:hypothetical protein